MELASPTALPFFVAGGTLERDVPSYVTRQADTDLLEGLQASEFCYVLTSRQMGKSSLVVRTAERLKAEGTSVASLDLTEYGSSLNAEQWYYAMLRDLGAKVKCLPPMVEFWRQNKEIGPLHRFFQALHEIVLPALSGNLVVFVDEIDYVRSLPFSTDEFFAAIRACYNSRTEEALYRRLTFCLLGVTTPADLIEDTRTTPFNIGKRIELTDFTLNQASVLQEGLPASIGQHDKVLARILYWTYGHPYLTQRICQHLATSGKEVSPSDVDMACSELFLSRRARENDDNLLFVRERLLRSGSDTTALLDLYARVRRKQPVTDDETNQFVSVLRLSGIVRAAHGRLVLRNRIYEQVFDLNWVSSVIPDELERQRRAYRAGLFRASSIAAIMLFVVSSLGWTAYINYRQAHSETIRANQNEKLARTQTDRANHLLYLANMDLVQKAWKTNVPQREQMRALLEDNNIPVTERNFEWYYWNRLCDFELLALQGHTQPVSSVAFSPNGKRIVTGSADHTARIWDVETGNQLLILQGHEGYVSSVAFSPNGKRIVTGSNDNTAKVWDAETGVQLLTLEGHSDGIWSVAFSPNGKRIVTGSGDKAARIWDAETGRPILTFAGHIGYVTSVAISRDGKRIVTGSNDNTAKIWDVAIGRPILTFKGHTDRVLSVAFSSDGKRIVTGSSDTSAKIWDAEAGNESLPLQGHTDRVLSVAFSWDGKRIVTGSVDRTARVWDAGTGDQLHILQGHTQPVSSVAFSPDGKRIVTGSDDNAAKVWNAETGNQLLVLQGHEGNVSSVAFSPDGKRIVTGSNDNTAKVWDAETGVQLLTLEGHTDKVWSVSFSSDGKRIATGSIDRTARVWDAGTGDQLLILQGHTQLISSVAFSWDGKRIATGSWDKTARVWDIETGRLLLTLQGHTQPVSSVAFSPDGKRIVTGSGDNTAKVWDTMIGRPILTLEGHDDYVTSVAFSSDGKRIATGSADHTARIWDTGSGRTIRSTHSK